MNSMSSLSDWLSHTTRLMQTANWIDSKPATLSLRPREHGEVVLALH